MNEIEREEIERAIEHIADNVRFLRTHPYVDDSLKHHELALIALKEKLTRQENAPLTWDELVSMTRKTVYIVDRTDDEKSGWAIVGKQYIKIGLEFITLCENLTFMRELKELYGQTWIAYRYEPKGEKE